MRRHRRAAGAYAVVKDCLALVAVCANQVFQQRNGFLGWVIISAIDFIFLSVLVSEYNAVPV